MCRCIVSASARIDLTCFDSWLRLMRVTYLLCWSFSRCPCLDCVEQIMVFGSIQRFSLLCRTSSYHCRQHLSKRFSVAHVFAFRRWSHHWMLFVLEGFYRVSLRVQPTTDGDAWPQRWVFVNLIKLKVMVLIMMVQTFTHFHWPEVHLTVKCTLKEWLKSESWL
jgi:hypothetical protein